MILIGRGLDFRYDLEPIGGSIRALARRMLPLLQLSKVDRLWVTAIAGKNKQTVRNLGAVQLSACDTFNPCKHVSCDKAGQAG